MQDMDAMQHSLTSPAQAHDTPKTSADNSGCNEIANQVSSLTDTKNTNETKTSESDVETNQNNETLPKLPNIQSSVQIMADEITEKFKTDEQEPKIKQEHIYEVCSDVEMPEIEKSSTDNPDHSIIANDDIEMKYQCPICDAILPSQHDFTVHIRLHNNNAADTLSNLTFAKGFSCKICSKVLSSSSSLDRHVLVHSGERPFKCRICGVAFTTNGNMHRHMRTHNLESSMSTSRGDESDVSSDSGGSSHGSRKSPNPSPIPHGKNKKRKVSDASDYVKVNIDLLTTSQYTQDSWGSKRKISESSFVQDTEFQETLIRRRTKSMTDSIKDSFHQCPVCERENFASLNSLEMHIEEEHPDYKAKCHICELIFKNHRALNLHRFMTHHETDVGTQSHNDRSKNNRNISQGVKNSVLGFRDLTFVDFSSEKFPHIARAVCEQSLHKASSAYHKFQCEKCFRAFPCGSALMIHRKACYSGSECTTDEFSSSDCETPTDLSKKKKDESHPKVLSDIESEEEQKREDFFAGLDLRTKSSVTPEKLSDDSKQDDRFENDSYFDITRNTKFENTKDLADIQSIISVTSASGFLNDLSKSPQPAQLINELTPPDSAVKSLSSDSGGCEEEQQDCFAAEFRKMKLKGEFPCRLCVLVFPNLRALKGHNRVHLMTSSGIFRCNMCPYSNTDKAVVVRHMRTHNGDRPYECSLCNYAFTTKANCERHLRNRHSKLTRDEVRKSIIYHPSEDPTNDPEMQGKITSREDVKRSLVFGHQTNTEEVQDSESSLSKTFEDKQNNLISLSLERVKSISNISDKADAAINTISEEQKKNHVQKDVKILNTMQNTQAENNKDATNVTRRLWEMQEASTMTNEIDEGNEPIKLKEIDDTEKNYEANQNILNSEDIFYANKKHITNTYPVTVGNSPRTYNLTSIPVPSFIKHFGLYKENIGEDNEENSPLDLSMDALDLSKKQCASEKEIYSSEIFSKECSNDENYNEPQDLSKKKSSETSFVDEDEKQSSKYNMSPSSQSSIDFTQTDFTKHLYNNTNNNRKINISSSPQRQSPSLTPKIDSPANFYANSSPLTSLFMNNNNFAFAGQNAFRLPPYFLSSHHHSLFHPTNMQDFSEMKERLQKELIRGLQLTSGGTMLDPLTMASSQAFHKQTLTELATRAKSSDLQGTFSDKNISTERDNSTNVDSLESKDKTNDKLIAVNNTNKCNKDIHTQKSSKESSSVKMVIKNGVLMPKQKQRRYRTERPFACEHCSARFTLRSNMERHIKQQHPQYWSQRQRNNAGNVGPGRRSYAAAMASISNQTQLNTTQSQESKCVSENFNIVTTKNTQNIQTVSQCDAVSEKMPKKNETLIIGAYNKTKEYYNTDSCDNNNKTYISDEVKLAIAHQLKSKLNVPLSSQVDEKKKECKEQHGEADEEDDENDGLIIDEEKDMSGNICVELQNQELRERDVKIEKHDVKDEAVIDLASVSRLLDNATSQNHAFQQYFKGTQDGEDETGDFGRCDGSEEEEEGLVAGSNSEGNNSGSDENRSECDNTTPKEKKKSAYSLAPNRVSCPYCQRKFPWSSSLRRHILTHTGQKPYKCPHCPLLFTTKSNCDRHLLRKHGGHSTSSMIGSGSNESPSNNNASAALTLSYTMRNVPERPYKCNFCPSSTFSTQSNLKKHVATKHGTNSSPTSPTASVTKSIASGDESGSVNNMDKRSDSCCGTEDCISEDNEEKMSIECDLGLSEKNDVKLHNQLSVDIKATLPVHTHTSSSDILVPKPVSTIESHGSSSGCSADLPFKCHLCEGSYAERQEALEHIKEIHPSEFDLLMSKGALETANVEDNNNVHHTAVGHDDANADENLEQLRGKFPDYANRKVMCAFCLRRFWSAEDLRRHMRTHTGERPFSCDICRRRFTLKHSMLRHRKKHNASSISAGTDDILVVSGDEDAGLASLTIPRSTDYINKASKLSIKMTNHNNNNITPAKGLNSAYNWENSKRDLALSAAQILSSKFSCERREDGTGVASEEDTDLIGNLLGIQDRSIIDKVLLSKSADDAAKLLGVINGSH